MNEKRYASPEEDAYHAMQSALNELERLRSVLLPEYEGKTGEPDSEVIDVLRTSIQRMGRRLGRSSGGSVSGDTL